MTDFACVPACIACQQADNCTKEWDIAPGVEIRMREHAWAERGPNSLPRVELKCGCEGIPWPLVRIAGKGDFVDCGTHGQTGIVEKVKKKKGYDDGPQLVYPGPPEF